MTDYGYRCPVLVRLREMSLDQRAPSELTADLGVEPAEVLRVGTVGFTAMLSEAQRAAAGSHPLVSGVEDNPECLAPLHDIDQRPDVPDRYVVCTLRAAGPPAKIVAAVDLRTADVRVMGIWLIATLTTDQLNALRRTPGVDFIAPAVMDRPA